MDQVMDEVEEVSVIAQLLDKLELSDLNDAEDIIEKILDAEIRIREIPIRLAEVDPQIKVAEIEANARIREHQIDADTAVRTARAANRWRIHTLWIIALIVIVEVTTKHWSDIMSVTVQWLNH